MVPPWVPEIPPPDAPPAVGPSPAEDPESQDDAEPAQGNTDPASPPVQREPVPIAPARRFLGANLNLGSFARDGDKGHMRRGLGQYIKKGYGGNATATRRMGGTIQTAHALYTALAGGAASPYSAPGNALDPALIAGKSANEIMDAVVEAVRPVDGTQDVEASRTSIKYALSEVLNHFPDANLLELDETQREFALERFVAGDVFRRIDLDLGKTIRDKAPNAAIGLGLLKEVRDYVRETVAASFRKLKAAGQRLAADRINQVVQSAIRETFQVFEGYAE